MQTKQYISQEAQLSPRDHAMRVEIAHVILNMPTYGTLTHHKTKTLHGRPLYKIWNL